MERRAELKRQVTEAEGVDDKQRLRRDLSSQSQTSFYHRDTVSMVS